MDYNLPIASRTRHRREEALYRQYCLMTNEVKKKKRRVDVVRNEEENSPNEIEPSVGGNEEESIEEIASHGFGPDDVIEISDGDVEDIDSEESNEEVIGRKCRVSKGHSLGPPVEIQSSDSLSLRSSSVDEIEDESEEELGRECGVSERHSLGTPDEIQSSDSLSLRFSSDDGLEEESEEEDQTEDSDEDYIMGKNEEEGEGTTDDSDERNEDWRANVIRKELLKGNYVVADGMKESDGANFRRKGKGKSVLVDGEKAMYADEEEGYARRNVKTNEVLKGKAVVVDGEKASYRENIIRKWKQSALVDHWGEEGYEGINGKRNPLWKGKIVVIDGEKENEGDEKDEDESEDSEKEHERTSVQRKQLLKGKTVMVDEGFTDGDESAEKVVEDEDIGKDKPSRGSTEKIVVSDDGTMFSKERKKRGISKDWDVSEILVNWIWDNEDMTNVDMGFDHSTSSTRVEPSEEETEYVPLKFFFGREESSPPEKTEAEKEMDTLWEDMALCIRSSEMDCTDYEKQVGNEDSVRLAKVEAATKCPKGGDHHLILDEEIGLTCKFCSFVELEIQYITAPLSDNPWGRSNRRSYGKSEHYEFHGLGDYESGDLQCGSNSFPHEKGTVWELIPGVKNDLYPHQSEGFEFIWKNIAGGIRIDELENPTAVENCGGCIISHAPGTGKTRLTLVFLQSYMKKYPKCRPIIIAPSNMLLTWEEEFQKWKIGIPFHNLNTGYSGEENKVALSLVKHDTLQYQKKYIRLVKLLSWKRDSSVMGISYTLFEKLVGNVNSKERGMFLELPGLIILDEGHTPRNDRSKIWKALSKIQTQKRIILSGTPFQNSFDELSNTFRLVRPKFAKKIGGSLRRRKTRENYKWASLDNSIDQVRAMIEKFVHVHKGSILEENLPGLRDSVVLLHPTSLQRSLLDHLEGAKAKIDQLTWAHHVSWVCVHPSLFHQIDKFPVDSKLLERCKSGLDPHAGVKTDFLLQLITLSQETNEKVIVFSQHLGPLNLIMQQLKSRLGWFEAKEVIQMNGNIKMKQRQSMISAFNDPDSEVRVLLASTTACCEGINLVGASRVVLLDVVWNPSVERQAISRAYRIGQKKVVYVYHLLAYGTMESEKYCRQVEKDRVSKLVFPSERAGDTQRISSAISEDMILEKITESNKDKHMFERIINQPKDKNLIETFGLVESP